MATIKKAQKGWTGGKTSPKPKMVAGEMTGKMYKKSEIDEIGRKQAAELDKVSVFGREAMKKKAAGKAKNGTKVKSFPDLNKDGKVTKADILKGRGVIAKKGAKVAKKAMPCASCGKSMKKK